MKPGRSHSMLCHPTGGTREQTSWPRRHTPRPRDSQAVDGRHPCGAVTRVHTHVQTQIDWLNSICMTNPLARLALSRTSRGHQVGLAFVPLGESLLVAAERRLYVQPTAPTPI